MTKAIASTNCCREKSASARCRRNQSLILRIDRETACGGKPMRAMVSPRLSCSEKNSSPEVAFGSTSLFIHSMNRAVKAVRLASSPTREARSGSPSR